MDFTFASVVPVPGRHLWTRLFYLFASAQSRPARAVRNVLQERVSIAVALSAPGEQAGVAAGLNALAEQDGSLDAGLPDLADWRRTPWSYPAFHEKLIPVLVAQASWVLARFLFVLVVAPPRLVSVALECCRAARGPVALFAAASSPDPVATASHLC